MPMQGGDPGLLAVPTDALATEPGVWDLGIVGSATNLVFSTGGSSSGLFNTGATLSGNPEQLREVRPGTSGLFGKDVQVPGRGPFWRGAVIAEIQLELSTTNGTGALTECVVVQGSTFRFIALAASVEVA